MRSLGTGKEGCRHELKQRKTEDCFKERGVRTYRQTPWARRRGRIRKDFQNLTLPRDKLAAPCLCHLPSAAWMQASLTPIKIKAFKLCTKTELHTNIKPSLYFREKKSMRWFIFQRNRNRQYSADELINIKNAVGREEFREIAVPS